MQGFHDQRAHVAYRRLLARSGHGYPLWLPEPDDSLPEEYRQTGISIGDVGLLTAEGGFDFLFNVHASADHPVNEGNVPRDFVALPWDQLGPRPIRRSGAMFRPQTSITSAEVKTRSFSIDVSAEAPGVAGGGFGLEFSTSRTQAAILTLPTGAARENATNLGVYKDYAAQHGKSWYQYVNSELRRCATNGTLYLVTGCDKTDSWGAAAFCHRPENNTEVSLKFLAAGIGESSFSLTSTWDTTMGIETRIFPSPGLSTVLTGYKNQCVFTRGFSIALRDNFVKRRVKGLMRISHVSGALHDLYPSFEGNIPFGSSSSSSHASSSSSPPSQFQTRSTSQLSEDSRLEYTSDSEVQVEDADDLDSEDSNHYTENEILNPSCLISCRILDMCSDADVAVVHDEEWLDLLSSDTVNDIGIDLEIIFRNMEPTVANGVGSLGTILRAFPSGLADLRAQGVKRHREETSSLDEPSSPPFPPPKMLKSATGEESNDERLDGTFSLFSLPTPDGYVLADRRNSYGLPESYFSEWSLSSPHPVIGDYLTDSSNAPSAVDSDCSGRPPPSPLLTLPVSEDYLTSSSSYRSSVTESYSSRDFETPIEDLVTDKSSGGSSWADTETRPPPLPDLEYSTIIGTDKIGWVPQGEKLDHEMLTDVGTVVLNPAHLLPEAD